MIYIFYHTDNDGYGSAATVLYSLLQENVLLSWSDTTLYNNTNKLKLVPYCYEKLNTFVPINYDDIKENDIIYIVDLSVSTNTKDKFIELCNNIYSKKATLHWIDHHTSSQELMSMDIQFKNLLNTLNVDYFINTNFCAMYNCWLHLLKSFPIPEIVRIIDDYDCWKLNLQGTKAFQLAFGIEDKISEPNNITWYKLFNNSEYCLNYIKKMVDNGNSIISYLISTDLDYCKSYGYETILCGLPCYVLNKRRNSDIFSHYIEDYDIVLSYIYNGDNYVYSVYSTKDEVDCSKVAELFGGGGHKGAAGFSTKHLIVNKLSSDNFNIKYRIKDFIRKLKYSKRVKH